MAAVSGTESSPLRVLLFSVGGAGPHYGGPGTSAWRLYRAAKPGRFDVELAHCVPHQEACEPFSAIHMLREHDPSPLGQWRIIRAARRFVRENARRFDVFHGLQGFEMTVNSALAARAAGLPAVVKLAAHRDELVAKPGLRHKLFNLARRRREKLKHVDAVIAISRDIHDELLGYGIPEDKIALIPNGVDTDRFRPAGEAGRRAAREQLGWPDRPTLLYVGGILSRKRPMLCVEVLGELRERHPDLQLAVVGPEREAGHQARCLAEAEALGVADALIFHGHTPDVALAYAAADVYLLPSKKEGMPNALLEAMASGLPCVATPISGSRDLIDDGQTGRLCPPDQGPTADAVGAYLADPALARRHGEAARAKIDREFSAPVVLDAHEALFRRITQ